MRRDDDDEINEMDELIEQFTQAADNHFEGFYMDSEDLFDVISYFIESFNVTYIQQGFEVAFKMFPDDPAFKLLHGKYMAITGDFESAESEFHEVELAHPDMAETYVEQVLLSKITHTEVDTMGLLKKALHLNYEIPEAHALLALEYLQRNDIEQALSHITTATTQENYSLWNLDYLLFSDLRQYSHDTVLAFLKALTDEFPMNNESWHLLGMAHHKYKEYEEALDAFRFQQSLTPDDAYVLSDIAECHYLMGNYPQAIKYYEQFAEANIYPVDIMIGRCHFKMKHYEAAFLYYTSAKIYDPLYLQKFHEIIVTCRAMNKLETAKSLFRYYLATETEDDVIAFIIPELICLLDPVHDREEIFRILDMVYNMDYSESDFFKFIIQLVYVYDTPEAFDLGLDIIREYEPKMINNTYLMYCSGIFYCEKQWFEKGTLYLEKAFDAINQEDFEQLYSMSPKPFENKVIRELTRRYQFEIPNIPEDPIFDTGTSSDDDYFFTYLS